MIQLKQALPRTTKIPSEGNGMAAISKIRNYRPPMQAKIIFSNLHAYLVICRHTSLHEICTVLFRITHYKVSQTF